MPSNEWHRASPARSWPATSSPRATSRRPTPTSSVGRSTPAPPACTNSWCSAPPRAWVVPRRRSPASTWQARPPIRAAASTGPAGGTPPAQRWATTVGSEGYDGRWCARRGRACCRRLADQGWDARTVRALGPPERQEPQAPERLAVARRDQGLPDELGQHHARPRGGVLVHPDDAAALDGLDRDRDPSHPHGP